jgi:steroid 5-alpha reductase family enzyme
VELQQSKLGLIKHPNYFGEILLWTGSMLFCMMGLKDEIPVKVSFLVSPLLVTLLLTKLSGIPMLEKASDARYGQSEDYQNYKRNVPVLIPRLTAYTPKKQL